MSAFGIASHEIVGYCTGQEFVCTGCIGDADDTDDCTPIFAGDEDANTTCDECGETLMESYTGVPAERDPDTKELLNDEEVQRRRYQEIAYELGEERPEEAEERIRTEEEQRLAERDRLQEIAELEIMLARLKGKKT